MYGSFLSTVLQSFTLAGDGPGPGFPGFNLPAGIPEPAIWFTADNVELDGGGLIDKFINQGSLGATHDATVSSASYKASVITPELWGGKNVIHLPDVSNGGYSFTTAYGMDTMQSITTYLDGVDVTFNTFNGLLGGPTHEWVASSGKAYWYFNTYQYFFDGVKTVGSNPVFLPALKKGMASTCTTSGGVNRLFQDDFSTNRNWRGECGDIMMWTETLTDAQITEVDTALKAYYSDAPTYPEMFMIEAASTQVVAFDTSAYLTNLSTVVWDEYSGVSASTYVVPAEHNGKWCIVNAGIETAESADHIPRIGIVPADLSGNYFIGSRFDGDGTIKLTSGQFRAYTGDIIKLQCEMFSEDTAVTIQATDQTFLSGFFMEAIA